MRTTCKLLAALAILAATPASAVTITAIRITNAIPTWLQVSEVQAFQGGTNVALATAGATATGSGNYVAETGPEKAIDGDISTIYPSLYHSDSPSAGEFLLISLAQSYDITTLTVFGRGDSGGAGRDLFDYALFNGGSIVATGQLDARGPTHNATATFAASSAVPEPTTWAMTVLGFGAAGAALRSTRKRSAATA